MIFLTDESSWRHILKMGFSQIHFWLAVWLFPSRKAKQLKSILDFSDWSMVVTALKINVEPKNEGLEDDFPFQKRRCSGSSRQFSKV